MGLVQFRLFQAKYGEMLRYLSQWSVWTLISLMHDDDRYIPPVRRIGHASTFVFNPERSRGVQATLNIK